MLSMLQTALARYFGGKPVAKLEGQVEHSAHEASARALQMNHVPKPWTETVVCCESHCDVRASMTDHHTHTVGPTVKRPSTSRQ